MPQIIIMKQLISMLLLLLSWFDFSKTTENSCKNQKYEEITQKELDSELEKEYSFLDDARKKLFSLFGYDDVTEEKLRQLCACAFYKKKYLQLEEGKIRKTYMETLLQTKLITTGNVISHFSYWYLFNYTPEFPFAYCTSGQDACVIFKGLQKKSSTLPLYNLYVGFIEERNNEDEVVATGVIRNVDMETSTDEVPAVPQS